MIRIKVHNDLKEVINLLCCEETFGLGVKLLENKGYISIVETIRFTLNKEYMTNFHSVHYNFVSKKCNHWSFIEHIRKLRKEKYIQDNVFSPFAISETSITWNA